MNKKGFSILASLLIILTLLILTLPEVMAKHDIVILNEPDKKIDFNSSYNITIHCDTGKIKYEWSILNFNNDKIHFYIEDENGDELGEPDNIWDKNGSKGEVSVKEGEYTIKWKNNNIDQPIIIDYTIEYPKFKEEEGSGCYSSMIILSILIIAFIILAISNISKKR